VSLQDLKISKRTFRNNSWKFSQPHLKNPSLHQGLPFISGSGQLGASTLKELSKLRTNKNAPRFEQPELQLHKETQSVITHNFTSRAQANYQNRSTSAVHKFRVSIYQNTVF